MSSWTSFFGGGRKDSRESARDAIVGLRQQLLMLEKKEEFLNKKIEEEMKKARANATGNKRCESVCLHRVIRSIKDLLVDRIGGLCGDNVFEAVDKTDDG